MVYAATHTEVNAQPCSALSRNPPNLIPTRAENVGKIHLKEAVVERQSFGLGFGLVLTEDREGVTEEKL